METVRTPRRRTPGPKILVPALLALLAGAMLLASPGRVAHADAPLRDVVPPVDGKYENVMVEGRQVAMVHVMEGGAVVLVDVDGLKPRSWEEQFKRKGDLPNGTYNVHKTNVNHSDTFEDDPIDREGMWVIDSRANLIAR